MVDKNTRTSSLALAALLIGAVGAVFFTPTGVSRRIKSVASDRLTVWNPGLNAVGGIPHRTTICATVNASIYGNGAQDAGPAIQVALDMCPDGQVVMLSAGDFKIAGRIELRRAITLRGQGPSLTRIRKPLGPNNGNVITIGIQWYNYIHSTGFASDGIKGGSTVTLADNPGLQVGELVLIDQLADRHVTTWGKRCQEGHACREWFSRRDRPTSQMMEIASISGNTITFTTAFHFHFKASLAPQLSRLSEADGSNRVTPAVTYAGVEDLYVSGGGNDNITMHGTAYSWVKGVESDLHEGSSIGVHGSFRGVVRDSYIHSTRNPSPGGGGYGIAISSASSDMLVENNIVWNMNKVMVMQSAGGGNVIAYNYMEDGWVSYDTGWVETGLNASHMAGTQTVLFEGNQAFNFDSDNVWGNATHITVFRNHLTGKRRSIPPLKFKGDVGNRRAFGLMEGQWWYTVIGNVLGSAGQSPAPLSGFAYEAAYPLTGAAVPMFILGYNPENWNAPPDPKVLATLVRGGNYDYATNKVHWQNIPAQTLPNSLYLMSKPEFFGSYVWPWVDPTGTTKLYVLPARARFDAGTPFARPPG
jgi:hypothetical protein